MKLFSVVLSVVLVILLAASILLLGVAFTADKTFLTEEFFAKTLEEVGLFDRVYERYVNETNEYLEEKYFPDELNTWYLDSFNSTCTKEAIMPIIKDAFADIYSVMAGETRQFKTLELSELDEQLKEKMAGTVDIKIAQSYSEASFFFDLKEISKEKAENELTPEMKAKTAEMFFEEHPKLDAGIKPLTTVDAFAYLGYDHAGDIFNTLQQFLPILHRYAKMLFLLLGFFTGALILIWIKKIRVGFRAAGWTYIVSSVCVVLIGAIITYSNKLYAFVVRGLDEWTVELLSMWNIERIKPIYGNEVISVGLMLLAAGIMLVILGIIFKEKRDKKSGV